MMVQKLSGFAKFDLDTKINAYQFAKLMEQITTRSQEVEKVITNDDGEQIVVNETVKNIDEQVFGVVMAQFEKAFKENVPPFQGDLENETYKMIVSNMRQFNHESHVWQR